MKEFNGIPLPQLPEGYKWSEILNEPAIFDEEDNIAWITKDEPSNRWSITGHFLFPGKSTGYEYTLEEALAILVVWANGL